MSSDENGSTFSYTKAAASDVASIKALIGHRQGRTSARTRGYDGGREGRRMFEVAQENYFQVITGPASFRMRPFRRSRQGSRSR